MPNDGPSQVNNIPYTLFTSFPLTAVGTAVFSDAMHGSLNGTFADLNAALHDAVVYSLVVPPLFNLQAHFIPGSGSLITTTTTTALTMGASFIIAGYLDRTNYDANSEEIAHTEILRLGLEITASKALRLIFAEALSRATHTQHGTSSMLPIYFISGIAANIIVSTAESWLQGIDWTPNPVSAIYSGIFNIAYSGPFEEIPHPFGDYIFPIIIETVIAYGPYQYFFDAMCTMGNGPNDFLPDMPPFFE